MNKDPRLITGSEECASTSRRSSESHALVHVLVQYRYTMQLKCSQSLCGVRAHELCILASGCTAHNSTPLLNSRSFLYASIIKRIRMRPHKITHRSHNFYSSAVQIQYSYTIRFHVRAPYSIVHPKARAGSSALQRSLILVANTKHSSPDTQRHTRIRLLCALTH